MVYETTILGGGASAMFCAITSNIKNICIIEKDSKIGKKILSTGNGRCNLTNLHLYENKYNVKDDDLKNYFDKFNNTDVINFFTSSGLLTYSDTEGRVYPITNSANTVLDILRENMTDLDPIVLNNYYICDIKYKNNIFTLVSSTGEYINTKKLVIACGGNTLNLLKNFNLNITHCKPSLGSIVTDKNINLAGVRVSNVKATLHIDDNTYTEFGEILFKETAISGICIFNLSSHIARKSNFKSATLCIDFLPNISTVELTNYICERMHHTPNIQASELLIGILHKALAINIINRLKINKNLSIFGLSQDDVEKIVNLIKKYNISCYGVSDNNQVYSGGIDLNCLDENLQSKKYPNLFITGEAVNIDGECGGYNLQWAWTSGFIVGNYLKNIETDKKAVSHK